MDIVIGDREYFKGVGAIRYEGPATDNPLAFRCYEPDRIVRGKRMEDLFRFAVAYWHSFCGTGADPFGAPTRDLPWAGAADPLDEARCKMDAAFEFMTKLGVPFYCFHDFDLVREGDTLAESERRLAAAVEMAKAKQTASGMKPLWGTANLFSHPRYMNGAATNPDFAVVARAGAQVKVALDVTIALGGEHVVFWGGREGYLSLLNTDMKREQAHLAEFLRMARDYARAQGLKGNLLIEPKPMEPTKHQYDYDAATVIGFLRAHGLDKDFKLNIEVNHSTLAGHAFEHELQVAVDAGMLGSMDANRGDVQNGWDTDQFPADLFELTQAMLILLEAGGFAGGGINFDAKLRRNSTDPEDLFIAHIGSMDLFARAALAADALIESSPIRRMRRKRYASFDEGPGAGFEAGRLGLADLHALADAQGEPETVSGRQELYESIVNRYI